METSLCTSSSLPLGVSLFVYYTLQGNLSIIKTTFFTLWGNFLLYKVSFLCIIKINRRKNKCHLQRN
nr:MAG TPA: hypothetical protein [Caudoviricetes sp.]